MTPGHKSMGKLHKSIAAFKWAPPKVSNQWCSQMQNMEIWEILWKIEQIHWILWSETKWQIGGAHRMAVSQHFVSEIECTQSKISTWDIYLSNFYQLFPVRDQMKAQEGVKVKFACFKGIVDPTDFQVSWGTWLIVSPQSKIRCKYGEVLPRALIYFKSIIPRNQSILEFQLNRPTFQQTFQTPCLRSVL